MPEAAEAAEIPLALEVLAVLAAAEMAAHEDSMAPLELLTLAEAEAALAVMRQLLV